MARIQATSHLLIVTLGWIVLAFTGPAAGETWRGLGPEGGQVRDLAIRPGASGTIYAACQMGGVYRSTDGGASWLAANAGTTLVSEVECLALDPQDNAVLYSGTLGSGVRKSTDGGATWNSTGSGLVDKSIYALAVDPHDSRILYTGCWGGLSKSTNGGGSWASAGAALPAKMVYGIEFDPQDSQKVFAAFYGAGVYRTTNGGADWTLVNMGLTNLNLYALLLVPGTPSTLYAGTYGGGVFRSTDAGNQWAAPNTGLTNKNVYTLESDPANPATLLAGTSLGGLFRSTDGGGTWTAASTGITNVTVFGLAVDPEDSSVLYAGTARGVSKSTNGGGLWADANSGLTALNVYSIAVDPQDGANLLAGADAVGVFQSSDSGSHWSRAGASLPNYTVMTAAFDPLDPSVVYAGLWGAGVYKSTDAGSAWTAVNTGITDLYINTLAIDPLTPGTLYAGATNGLVFRSTDAGAAWIPADTGAGAHYVYDLEFDPAGNALYACAGKAGVYRSTNGGASWGITGAAPGGYLYEICLHSARSNTMYVATSTGVFLSTDGGAAWSPMNTGLVYNNVLSLALNPQDPETLYAGTTLGGVYRSTDGGAHWNTFNEGLPALRVEALTIDPLDPSRVYAGGRGGGVHVIDINPCPLPVISAHPQNQTVAWGQAATLAVIATGTPPLAYQWYQGASGNVASPVGSATGNSFATAALTATTSFWVRVSDACGTADSATATVTVTPPPFPLPPSNLTAAAASASQINLAWKDNSANEEGFKIERRAGPSGTWAQAAAVGANVTAWQNTGLVAATDYTFRVYAHNALGNSPTSNEASGTTQSSGTPNAPSNLTATAVSSNQIHLGWSDNSSNETGFKIERKTPGKSAWVLIAQRPATETHFDDRSLAPDIAYTYRVRATGSAGDSANSNEATATPSSALPAAPSGLATAVARTGAIILAWTDNAANETGFQVERRAGTTGAFAQAGTTGANVKAWLDTSVTAGTTYFYRVRASNAAGTSAYSNTATAGPDDYDLFIPAAAHTPGANDTLWRSDVDLVNLGSTTAAVQIALLLKDQGNPSPAVTTQVIPAGQTVRLGDVLGGTPFTGANAALGMRLIAGAANVNSRFYNTASACGGTYGMYVDAVGNASALCGESGATRGVFHHLSHSAAGTSGFRTNIGFVNASSFNVQVVIRAYGDAGELLGAMSHVLQPYEHRQFTKIHEILNTPDVAHGDITVEVVTAGGRVHPYAMLIDNVSGDPVYMPVKVIPY